MQSTPFEVKRLEYQLRLDAANRCPGTDVTTRETEALDSEPEPTVGPMALIHHIAEAIAAVTLRRSRVHLPQ